MSERQGILVRNGLVGASGFAVLVLLMLFHATVSGAVERAARQRADAADSARSRVAAAVPASARKVASLAGARP